ncbi:MAG: hypothetical protein IJB79_04695 [Candidatus Gastranaerophilales bacterium]|nr:hypothetical protein [Candidatus Gastranaerophilales bacterium]
MGAVVTMTFKKAKVTKHTQFRNGMEIHDCNSASDSRLLTIDNVNGRNEFFTIQLVGGGAAGSDQKGGAAGETKIVHYPTMSGQYFIKLGAGGQRGTNINGGTTAIYKVTDTGAYELMEFALGGVGSNERIFTEDIPSGKTAADLARGEVPNFDEADTGGAIRCGSGGDAGNNGIMGGVVIKW